MNQRLQHEPEACGDRQRVTQIIAHFEAEHACHAVAAVNLGLILQDSGRPVSTWLSFPSKGPGVTLTVELRSCLSSIYKGRKVALLVHPSGV
jgi:hypothetical protein